MLLYVRKVSMPIHSNTLSCKWKPKDEPHDRQIVMMLMVMLRWHRTYWYIVDWENEFDQIQIGMETLSTLHKLHFVFKKQWQSETCTTIINAIIIYFNTILLMAFLDEPDADVRDEKLFPNKYKESVYNYIYKIITHQRRASVLTIVHCTTELPHCRIA